MRLRLCFAAFLVCLMAVQAGHTQSGARDKWRSSYRSEQIPFPEDNPFTPAKERLGRLLFFDPLLSGPGTISCASCHNPALSWSNGLQRSIGASAKVLAQRVPTLLDVAWSPVLGWDGKFRDLENVAFGPMTNPDIMNNTETELLRRLNAIPGYVAAFANAFPGEGITRRNVEEALATFERTIVSGTAPFDRWVQGQEDAIGEPAKRGFDLFNGKAACAECHQGSSFTDGSFQDIGTAKDDDVGRGRFFPDSVKLRYAFKVPTLRDVARRAPYMHDGSVATLQEVIDLYDRGGIDRPGRSELIHPLGLSPQEKADLIAFLATLTEEPRPFEVPVLPR
jgi:cytochrome c peroxidase